MPLDRRTSRWLNGLCATVALGAVAGVGWIAYKTGQADRPTEVPTATAKVRDLLREARKAARDRDVAGAKDCFEEAIRLNPRHENARYEYARFLLAQGSEKQAWTQLDAYVPAAMEQHRTVTGGASAMAWYGDLAAKYGDPKLGDAACRGAIAANWEHPGKNAKGVRLRALAHCAAGGGLFFGPPAPDRIEHDRRAVELDPTLPLGHLTLAHALIEDKQPAEARKHIEAAVPLITPDRVDLKVVAAHFLSGLGEKSRALAILQWAAQHAPAADTGLASMIGWELLRAGKTTEARGVVDRAMPLASPQRTKVYVELAVLLAQLGKPADAQTMVRRAEKTAPAADRAAIQEALAQISKA